MTRSEQFLRLGSLALSIHCVATAALWGPRALNELGREADVVVVARLQAAERGPEAIRVQLEALRVLKGPASSRALVAEFFHSPQSPGIGPPLGIPGVGSVGLWFLKEEGGAYRVLPQATAAYSGLDAYLPLMAADAEVEPSGTLDRQLLMYLTRSYEEFSSVRGDTTDWVLLRTLLHTDRQDALPMIRDLIVSPKAGLRIIGLTAGLRLGSDDALATLMKEYGALQTEPKFFLVRMELATTLTAESPTSFRLLEQMAAAHSDLPNLDDEVAAALARAGGKSVLPIMANLLDSKNEQAKLRAASYFARFAMFADEDGNLRPGHAGPFMSQSVQANAPRNDSGISADQYAQYWKSWWTQHRTLLE